MQYTMNMGADTTRIWEYFPGGSRSDDEHRSGDSNVSRRGGSKNLRSSPDVEPIWIVLRHNPVTNFIQVTAGEKELFPGDLQFRLDGHVLGRVVVEPIGTNLGFMQRFSSYRYACYIEDDDGEHRLIENLEKIRESYDAVQGLDLKLSEVVIDGQKIAWFHIKSRFTLFENGKSQRMRFSVHRRFRDFRMAYKQLASSYKDHHLRSSLPKHPPKEIAFLKNHAEHQFVTNRRTMLETWLRNTLAFPRAATNPDLLTFLGMGRKNLREVSVVVDNGQSLGLKMKKRISSVAPGSHEVAAPLFPQAQVLAIVPDSSGNPGVAAGKIVPGDVITKVGGESVVNTMYDRIIDMVATYPRPLVIHFLTRLNVDAENMNGAAQSSEEFYHENTGKVETEDVHNPTDNETTHTYYSRESEEHFVGEQGESLPFVPTEVVEKPVFDDVKLPMKVDNESSEDSLFARVKPKDLSEYLVEKKITARRVRQKKQPTSRSSTSSRSSKKVTAISSAHDEHIVESLPTNDESKANNDANLSGDESSLENHEVMPSLPPVSNHDVAPVSSHVPTKSDSFAENSIRTTLLDRNLVAELNDPPAVPPRGKYAAPTNNTQGSIVVNSDEALPNEKEYANEPEYPIADDTTYRDDDLEDVSL